MKYFLKRCGFQELGSVGNDGKAKRGRYLMTSRHDEVVNFFPALSIGIPNDTALLLVVPLYTFRKTYVSYVYHNSKYTGSDAKHKRNEYRIYLNNEIEDNKLYFSSEDIVIMRKSDSPFINDDGDEQYIYYLDVVKDHSTSTYFMLSRIIEQYPINGGYGMYDGVLDFFEEKVKRFELAANAEDIQIDKSVADRIQKATSENQNNVFNPATFRDFVLAGYGHTCAVTGEHAQGDLGCGLDVVYIKPKTLGGSYLPCNGIALSKQISLCFVRGEFTLSPQYEILVHPLSKNQLLKEYNGKQIRVPTNSFFRPDEASMNYHREFVYGNFVK